MAIACYTFHNQHARTNIDRPNITLIGNVTGSHFDGAGLRRQMPWSHEVRVAHDGGWSGLPPGPVEADRVGPTVAEKYKPSVLADFPSTVRFSLLC